MPADDRSIVVILSHETRVFAVLADGIVGVMPLTLQEINPIGQTRSHDDQQLFASTFRVDQHTGVVLDPAAILALPGMIASADRSAQREAARRIDDPILVFWVAGLRLDHPRGLGPTIRLNDGCACALLDLAGEAERLLNQPSLQVA